MAQINEALKITLKHEGGYVYDPDDPGGETYKGIARNSNPNWKGWESIDNLKHKPNFELLLETPHIHNLVSELYRTKYWNVINGDGIENQDVANKIFDIAVNMGPGTAAKLVQITLGVLADGDIGPKTLMALNAVNFDLFMSQFRIVIISRYMAICKKRYKSRKFLYGWIKRALS